MLAGQRLRNIKQLFFRFTPGCLSRKQCAAYHISGPLLKKKPSIELPDMDKPIPFSSSKASNYRSVDTFSVPEKLRNRPWYEPIVIVGSFAALLIYFTMLREENDIDEELGKTLYERFPDLEESQLRVCIKYELEKGNDVSELQARLKEVIARKKDSR